MRATVLSIVVGLGLAICGGTAEAEDDGSLSEVQVQRAVKIFSEGAAACNAAPMVYRIDCYQVVFGKTARTFGKASAYWEAEVALTRVSRTLFTFVRANTDSNLGKERIAGGRVKAVTEASLPKAETLFVSSVVKAESILRNGTAYENRYFEPMADAIADVRDAMN